MLAFLVMMQVSWLPVGTAGGLLLLVTAVGWRHGLGASMPSTKIDSGSLVVPLSARLGHRA